MFIRPATAADSDAVTALLARSYPLLLARDYAPDELAPALPMMTRARPELLACGTYYVVEDCDVVIGAGGWTPDADDPTLAHIRHLATDPRELRAGVATWLMHHSFDAARAAGVQRMECRATRTAERFYHAVGFRTLGPLDVDMGAQVRFPAIRMERALEA
ncbi:GNAT family N-acetyltransferase [Pseudosulfitobacter pseudonitzschiae]|uniref:GNAT family N-acetyltransferase n=1 Tax=Pseudosulfitobacter pseudonitzschiae TaxID=1402135 RepID=UPI001AF9B81B|nr:GNAT family N-acetyltransferase [Pseudosulfitobacter pseudonitzschiae]MBM1813840.1 GNAT family N-acetyltransferase [Pseudosulfitobacter pseudonitzschiae]MBM1830833.1 GNAT family N-acetyltransferase [Pseudosulfitobacter pseudonitzschiae]MBM1835700.1 GNAT family N-acetyltransferase [Pseudosulfitobacter pseudonitzschiae]MBM1840546.1 GNAT family N-acetyltransferase [Pseudosulfitobacter pseudonitzschiae]MBM1845466.1 GNAT family N-acetyltransferase [Pseudosulfitobacter pseudonitzschiae]